MTGTCVSVQENSGGFPTALFCFQSALCIVAATLSLVLVDGLGKWGRHRPSLAAIGFGLERVWCGLLRGPHAALFWKAFHVDSTIIVYRGGGGLNTSLGK